MEIADHVPNNENGVHIAPLCTMVSNIRGNTTGEKPSVYIRGHVVGYQALQDTYVITRVTQGYHSRSNFCQAPASIRLLMNLIHVRAQSLHGKPGASNCAKHKLHTRAHATFRPLAAPISSGSQRFTPAFCLWGYNSSMIPPYILAQVCSGI